MSENKINLRKEQVQLIETLAVPMEKTGMQPAQAKIVSLLLVNDDPEMTFDEIRETLGISKSATSAALNHLLVAEKVEYKSKIGDRKRYFCSRLTSWQDDVKAQWKGMAQFGDMLQAILDQRPATTKDFNQSLQKLIHFLRFLNAELPALMDKFEKQYH